jgi:hypothetical protein
LAACHQVHEARAVGTPRRRNTVIDATCGYSWVRYHGATRAGSRCNVKVRDGRAGAGESKRDRSGIRRPVRRIGEGFRTRYEVTVTSRSRASRLQRNSKRGCSKHSAIHRSCARWPDLSERRRQPVAPGKVNPQRPQAESRRTTALGLSTSDSELHLEETKGGTAVRPRAESLRRHM